MNPSNTTDSASPGVIQKKMNLLSGSNALGATKSQYGDVPSARFGHTTTYVGQSTVIMFGGAVGDSGRYQITNDTYMLDVKSIKWTYIKAENAPSPRAAHAAACVDTMQLVVYGGATGGGSLSTDELYLLDLRKHPHLSWMTVPITGETPGRRYGHSVVYNKPNLIVFGGNDGQKSVNDIWFMDVEKSPFMWNSVTISPSSEAPPPRVYHSAEVCKEGPAFGMMVIFGGRTTDSRSLGDIWGLRQHRDGRWDWVEAPVKKGPTPFPRFQHSALFLGTKMLTIGGRNGEVGKALQTALYDTEACEWRFLPSVGRFRHSCWNIENVIYTFGGFDYRTQSHPTADLHFLDVTTQSAYFSEKEKESMKRTSPVITTLPIGERPVTMTASQPVTQTIMTQGLASAASEYLDVTHRAQRAAPAVYTRTSDKVRISAHVHTKVDSPHDPDFSALVRKIAIDRLEDEGRRLRGAQAPLHQPQRPFDGDEYIADKILRKLMRPNITPSIMERYFNPQSPFILSWDDVSTLCIAVTRIMKLEPSCLRLRTPIKVYGDLHGQYYDMMRLFGSYKAPVSEDWVDKEMGSSAGLGDIDSMDYLFLGDYVDRGTHSLEVICLLFALKLRFPKQVHLIRGNHEDSAINAMYGFKEECRRRLREDPDHAESCWEKFNRAFEWLPLAALIEERIICLHGGIGGSLQEVSQLAEMQRPLKVAQVPCNEIEQRVTDLLWSDPSDNDSMRGILPNDTRDPDGSGHIVKFGPDRVIQFLQVNRLDLIIRAHECVMDGFERFAGGKLITLFSATDYCGHHKNAGALLFIRRDLTVVPKLIYPFDRESVDVKSTWINLDARPPTPPRVNRRIRDSDLGF